MLRHNNVPFSEIGSIRVGGPVAEVIEVSTEEELLEATREVWDGSAEWMILGDGTNTLVADSGFPGTMIRTVDAGGKQFAKIVENLSSTGAEAESFVIQVWAGINWDSFVEATVIAGFADLAPLSGIPGTVGAAPIQNIAAYGGEVAKSIVSVRFLDYETGEIQDLTPEELEFSYRSSVLQRKLGAVASVTFRLLEKSVATDFEQILSRLQIPAGSEITATELRDTVLTLRSEKGMLISEADPDSVSLGSFFKNPVVSQGFAAGIKDGPKWQEENGVKLSAAWLIDNSGIHKGYQLPGSDAGISSKHTLAITNRGSATSAQIIELANFVQTRVAADWGVNLQPEPIFVGFED